jgi:hypothetical protein
MTEMVGQEFMTGRSGNRLYRVDDEGVSEFGRDRVPIRFISWPDLDRLTTSTACSAGGECIRWFSLDRDQHRKLLRLVQTEWRARYPDAWRKNYDRSLRQLRWSVRLLPPLLPALFNAAAYMAYWWLGPPPQAVNVLESLNKYSVGIGVLALTCWLYDLLWLRRFRDRPPY